MEENLENYCLLVYYDLGGFLNPVRGLPVVPEAKPETYLRRHLLLQGKGEGRGEASAVPVAGFHAAGAGTSGSLGVRTRLRGERPGGRASPY